MSIKSPSRRWGALLAGSAVVLSTAVVGLTGVAQAEPEPTATECTTEPTTTAPTTTAPTTTAAETTAAETTAPTTTESTETTEPTTTAPSTTESTETTEPTTTAPSTTESTETTEPTTTAPETTAPGDGEGEVIPGALYAAGFSIAEAMTAFAADETCGEPEPTPTTTAPSTTESTETTEPTTTAPETTAPETTTPETTAPETTTPETTAPETTTPETTTPGTTTPGTTTPTTTAPVTTTAPEAPKVVIPAVRDIKASVGTSSILVTWNAPVNTAGIVGYQAFANPVGAQSTGEMVACLVDAAARSCRLGVEAGRAYSVGVIAFDKDAHEGEAGDFVTTGVVPAPVTAATPPAGNTSLKKADGSAITNVTAGQTMTLRGEGYLPFSTVALYVYSTPTFLGNVTADKDGRFTVDVTIPASLANGEHSLVASGVDFNGNAYVMRSDFTVGAAGAQQAKLPFTGASVALPLLGGLVATGVGGGLLVAARRRSNA